MKRIIPLDDVDKTYVNPILNNLVKALIFKLGLPREVRVRQEEFSLRNWNSGELGNRPMDGSKDNVKFSITNSDNNISNINLMDGLNKNYPLFLDKEINFMIQPIYVKSTKSVIVVIETMSRVTAKRIEKYLVTQRKKNSVINTRGLGNYIIPKFCYEIMGANNSNMNKLRDVELSDVDYVTSIAGESIDVVTNLKGNSETLISEERQHNIRLKLGLEVENEVTFDKETGLYAITFNFEVDMLVPYSTEITYDISIYNELLPQEFSGFTDEIIMIEDSVYYVELIATMVKNNLAQETDSGLNLPYLLNSEVEDSILTKEDFDKLFSNYIVYRYDNVVGAVLPTELEDWLVDESGNVGILLDDWENLEDGLLKTLVKNYLCYQSSSVGEARDIRLITHLINETDLISDIENWFIVDNLIRWDTRYPTLENHVVSEDGFIEGELFSWSCIDGIIQDGPIKDTFIDFIFTGQVEGVIVNGVIYTGLMDGWILDDTKVCGVYFYIYNDDGEVSGGIVIGGFFDMLSIDISSKVYDLAFITGDISNGRIISGELLGVRNPNDYTSPIVMNRTNLEVLSVRHVVPDMTNISLEGHTDFVSIPLYDRPIVSSMLCKHILLMTVLTKVEDENPNDIMTFNDLGIYSLDPNMIDLIQNFVGGNIFYQYKTPIYVKVLANGKTISPDNLSLNKETMTIKLNTELDKKVTYRVFIHLLTDYSYLVDTGRGVMDEIIKWTSVLNILVLKDNNLLIKTLRPKRHTNRKILTTAINSVSVFFLKYKNKVRSLPWL